MVGNGRVLLEGYPYHLVRRTKGWETAFIDEGDFAHGAQLLHHLADEYGVRVHAWCLLADRVHLLATQPRDGGVLSTLMKAFTCRLALWRREVWNLPSPWDARFRSSLVEPGQWTLACMAFIERLPVTREIVSSAYRYPHSSYRMRLGKSRKYWLDDPEEYRRLGDDLDERAQAYRTYLRAGLDPDEEKMIEEAVLRNRPTASEPFLNKMAEKNGVEITH